MILINEGDTLIIESGYYEFEDGLSLDVDGVTVVGRGMKKPFLILESTIRRSRLFSNFEWSNA